MADVTAERRLSVLHVISGLTFGGAEGMLAALVTSAMLGIEHRVVSLKSGGAYAGWLRAAGVAVDELGFGGALSSASGLWRLVNLIRDTKPDVVQGWLYHGDLAALLPSPCRGAAARPR